MAFDPIQSGDSDPAVPGTSNQTGNNAPKFPWMRIPEGRVARIGNLCIARRLKFNDVDMAVLHRFPHRAEFYHHFRRLFPWFEQFYNDYRVAVAQQLGYPVERLDPFGPDDPHGRLRYFFATPGSKGEDGESRLYGFSDEYPLCYKQQKPGGLGKVYFRCSKLIDERLVKEAFVTREEAQEWGAL